MSHIRIGHTISRRGGLKTYRARAYVDDAGAKHTRIVALGDTVEEAETAAIKYVRDAHARDGVPAPKTILNAGYVRAAFLDAWLF